MAAQKIAIKSIRPLSIAVKSVLIVLIYGIRPLLGPATGCKYDISCSQFAIIMLHQEPLYKALYRISQRVLSCNPFSGR